MTVIAPPRAPRRTTPIEPPAAPLASANIEALVQALIEEARQRARRRRLRNGAMVVLVMLGGITLLSLLGRPSPATLEADDAVSASVAPSRGPTGTIMLAGVVNGSRIHVFRWTPQRVADAGIEGRAFGWSPDGSRLLVQRASALYAVRMDGGGETLLTRHGDGFEAAWSPDGTRVAYEAGAIPGRPMWRRLVVVGADGHGARVLPGWARSAGFFSGNVTWSRDGKDVVFSGRTASNPHSWLYRVALDGLTAPRPIAIEAAVRNPGQPSWSPDGSKLAFSSDAVAGTVGNLFVMNADGSHARRIADGATGPVWSPDGSMLAFFRHGKSGGIWTARADGTHLRKLPAGSWYGLSWSPDSRYIAFAGGSGHASNGDVLAVRPDGTGLMRILHQPERRYGLPLWRGGTATTEAG